jgi:hypothetical protein
MLRKSESGRARKRSGARVAALRRLRRRQRDGYAGEEPAPAAANADMRLKRAAKEAFRMMGED